MNQLITAFNSGEVSPLLAGRVDLPNMARACRIMQGFIPGITGGAFRRPPLLNVGGAIDNAGARLIPFNSSAGSSFQLEIETDALRIWKGDGSGLDAEIVAPWAASELDGIQFVQSNDVMWFVSPGRPVQELQHVDAGVWTLNEIPWKYPPLRDENLEATTITPSGLTGNISLFASDSIFRFGHPGSYFEISHFRAAASSELVVPIIPAAAAILPFTVLPVADTTFSVNGTVYTWKTAANVSGPGHVEIDDTGSSADEKIKFSRDNAIAAINAVNRIAGTPGFGIGTRPNPDVSAENGGDSTTSSSATGVLTTDGTNSFTSGTNTEITVGTITYRAESGTMHISGSTYDFRAGATDQETLANLVKAVNLNGVAGTDYVAGMVINPNATATLGTAAVTFTAKAPGLAGNAVATTTAHTGGHQSFGASTLTGGTATPTYKLKVVSRVYGDPGNLITVADTAGADHWLTTTLSGGAYFNGTSPEITVKGTWDFTTYGRWIGNVYVEQRNAAGTWDVLRQATGRLDTNRTFAGVADPTAVLRIRVENMAGATSSDQPVPRFLLEATQSLVHGLVKITGIVNGLLADALVINELYSTVATPNWREGAFSNYRGFPAAVTLHEQRLVFAGNASESQKIWASAAGDFRNFEETGFDDGSWQFALATQQGNAIRWVASQQGLIIGTAGDEWLMDGGAEGITPTNAQAKRQSAYGSDPVQALVVGSLVIMVERGGLKLREYVFDYQSVSYVAPDISQIVEHLTRTSIRIIAHQRAPWSILWVVTWDGKLNAVTYARENEVIAWAPIPIDGEVKSVSVVYGARGAADEVWLVIDRAGSLRIERFDPQHWIRLHAGEFCFHMDAATTGTVASPGVFSGFSYLEGQAVKAAADGIQVTPDPVVSGGQLTIPGATSVIAGRAQPDSALQAAIFDIPTRSGTSQGNKVLTIEFAPRFYMTRTAGYARAPGKEVFDLNFRDSIDPGNASPPPFSGLKEVRVPGNYDDSSDLTIYSQGIQTTVLLALTVKATAMA